MCSAFLYGTLAHPEILKRVLGNDGTHLTVAPALLPDYTRHHIKGCDYPAIVPYAAARAIFDRELDQEEKSVRGTVVSGLKDEELRLLDEYEGSEYTRQRVSISPLASFSSLSGSSPALSAPKTPVSELVDYIEVETYVWVDRVERLAPELWSLETFVQEKLYRWVGNGTDANCDYAIFDERRAFKRKPPTSYTSSQLESPKACDYPQFGNALLPQFCFRKGYVNLNHGSYGSLPRPVFDAVEALSLEAESNPDRFLRQTYFPLSVSVREKLADLIGAKIDEVVMIPNATHGVNTVLRNFVWEANDVLVGTTTTYGAVLRMFQYIHDLRPHPAISIMNVTFPVSHATILERFREHLRAIPRKAGQKIVAVIDSIVSNPGCIMPWDGMVQICREENVWSLVDAAHSIGQEVGIRLGRVNPDFWVSDCHKWLFAKRGCAVLYVPRRNQYIIQSTLPTSFGYVSPEDPPQLDGSKPHNFVNQFDLNGTIDTVPYLSVQAALLFRESLGGDARINEYCHDLALKGGKRLAELLQTNVMDEDGSLTANMVNVRLPLLILPSLSIRDQALIRSRIEHKLLDDWDCFAAVFTHDGKWWTRCSAQVWNELADFEYLANAFLAICAELRNEQHTRFGKLE